MLLVFSDDNTLPDILLEFKSSSQKNGCWDVAVFKIICKIKPTDTTYIEFEYPSAAAAASNTAEEEGGLLQSLAREVQQSSGGAALVPVPTPVPAPAPVGRVDLVPMRGSSKIPEVEQTLRLISYQGKRRVARSIS